MKRLMRVMLVGGFLIASSVLTAQETTPEKETEKEGFSTEGTPEERARKRTDHMKLELSLNENQEEQIYAIAVTHIIEMDKLREEQKALREKMKAEKEKTRTKIKAILTPEQNVIFDQKAEEHKKNQEEKKAQKQN